MAERAMPERICPQCGVATTAAVCPVHDVPTLARVPGGVDTVQPGEVISGRYRIDKLLGKGGFGAVFRATHVVTQQELVLKVLKPNLGDDETQVKRFLQEARTASKLSHPHTVRVYDFGQTESGQLYLAMELLHGQELGQVLLQDGTLPPERAIHVAIGVLKSLAEAHQAGLVHRDLKPDNIFLCSVHGEEDFVKVIDFGIAKPIDQGDDGGLTRTGFTVGTPKYMSPEQVTNKGVDGRSDLYALGVILYQALSGELPLTGASPVETMMAHVQQEPIALALRVTQPLPDGLADVVMRALRKQASQRFVDAEDMRAALEEIRDAAGYGTGRKARSAKLRAVATPELAKTEMHAIRPVTDRSAQALGSADAVIASQAVSASAPRAETPTTEDGIDATRIAHTPSRPAVPIEAAASPSQPQAQRAHTPAAGVANKTLVAPTPEPPAQAQRTVRQSGQLHVDATLDVAQPRLAHKSKRSGGLLWVALLLLLALAGVAGWLWTRVPEHPAPAAPPQAAPVAEPTPPAAPEPRADRVAKPRHAAKPGPEDAPGEPPVFDPPAGSAEPAPPPEPPVAAPSVEIAPAAKRAPAKASHRGGAKPATAKPDGDEAL